MRCQDRRAGRSVYKAQASMVREIAAHSFVFFSYLSWVLFDSCSEIFRALLAVAGDSPRPTLDGGVTRSHYLCVS